MTDGELIQEIRLLRQEFKENRAAVEENKEAVEVLSRRSFWQKVFNWAVAFTVVAVIVLGVVGWINAGNDRDAIRHEACVANRTSAVNSRLANEIFISSVITVLSPEDTEGRESLERLRNEVLSQHDKLLPVPECD